MDPELFEKLEILFPQLFALLQRKLPREMLAAVQHFFDHGEYGLALEELGGVFLATNDTVSENELEIINKLADLMNMQDDEMVDVMRNKLAS